MDEDDYEEVDDILEDEYGLEIEEEVDEEEVPEEKETENLDAEKPPAEEEEEIDTEVAPEVSHEEIEARPVIAQILKKDDNHRVIHIIPDNERTTSHILQHFEKTEAIGIRISQIEDGSPVFTDVTGLTSPIDMAHKEFNDGKNPLILQREVRRTEFESWVELWKVREMDSSN